jgi:hypothetical protein
MKMGLKFSVFLPICLTFMISCKKWESGSNSTPAGCISEETATESSLAAPLTQPQLDTINTLFAHDNLSTANQQFWSILNASVIPYDSSVFVNEVEILSYRWYNNLPVFMWNDNYLFYNGILQPSLIYNGPAPGPNTTFRQSLSSVRAIWLNNFMKVATYWPIGTRITYPDASYRDSCLTAQAGYVDAANFNSTIPRQTLLVKAWQVAPTGSNYPMIYIEDSTGAAWPFDVFIP